MYLTVLGKMCLAGFVMLLWLRIIASTNFAYLSWPFAPLDFFAGQKYNTNVRFSLGLALWFLLSSLIALFYWSGVENGFLTYYDFGSSLLFSFLLWLLTVLFIFPLVGLGIFGFKLGRWVWLESLVSWLIFGVIFGLLIS